MSAARARILVLEDDTAMRDLLADELIHRGFAVDSSGTPEEAERALDTGTYDLLVTDVRLGSADGIDFLERLRGRDAEGPPPGVVVITAFGTVETAVRAMRAGAVDYLTKPFEMAQLVLCVERVLEQRRLRGEITRLRRELREAHVPFVAASPAMKEVAAFVGRVADADATVLVTGPSGSGKEVVARALHERSRRADGPFVPVNCAALPEALLESELFGYRKGAFTDARGNKDGLFKAAEGGTIFLDEVGEIPLSIQPKLLRVLQNREVTPLGATRAERVNVRVVAATNQELERRVEERLFREDLFYRLNVIRLELPPLSVRGEDVMPLALMFLQRFSERAGRAFRLAPEAEAALQAYSWPGNVRELENALERATALCRGELIGLDDLPPAVVRPQPSRIVEGAVARRLTLEQLSNEYCAAVVRHYGNNQSAAARHLDIDRKTLARRLEDSGTGGVEP